MKRFLVLVGAIAAALVMLLGATGPASADNEYAGLTYEKVQQRTKNRAVIASRVGDYLPTEQCVVTGSRTATFLDTSGNNSGKILVHLNCNDPQAAGGDGSDHPGYSVATPQGRKMAQLKERAQRISTNYANAVKAGKPPACEKSFDGCKRICQQSGACSAELNEYLGL